MLRTQTANAKDRAPPGPFPGELHRVHDHGQSEENEERDATREGDLVAVGGSPARDICMTADVELPYELRGDFLRHGVCGAISRCVEETSREWNDRSDRLVERSIYRRSLRSDETRDSAGGSSVITAVYLQDAQTRSE